MPAHPTGLNTEDSIRTVPHFTGRFEGNPLFGTLVANSVFPPTNDHMPSGNANCIAYIQIASTNEKSELYGSVSRGVRT